MILVNRIGGVKITVLASCVVDRVFESWSGYMVCVASPLSTQY